MPPRRKNKIPQADHNKIVAYVRVSTEQQVDEGHSLEAQQQKLASYAQAFGLEIVAVEVDAGVSGSTTDRPALQRALARLESGEASALLVVKLDRLTRSVRDLSALLDRYFTTYRLLSISENVDTQSAIGRAILRIITTMSEWEREAAAERTATVMRHLKANNKFTGGWPPYGYTKDEDGNLVACPPELMVIQRAKQLRADGASLRSIASALGPNTRTGKPFDSRQISRML
jgi:site-specific DNA recombinase